MIRLDAASVLLQWAAGGLLFCWVTTRGRLVGLGYGWLLRVVYGVLAAGSLVAANFVGWVPVRDASAVAVVVGCAIGVGVSVRRREAGVSGQQELRARRKARVDAMAGAAGAEEVDSQTPGHTAITMRDQFGRVMPERERSVSAQGPEFPPLIDLVTALIGFVGLVAAGWDAGGNELLSIGRTVVGAVFLGVVSDAMLLGHWYLVQPGLPRRPIGELNDWLLRVWPFEVVLFLLPTGMVSALNGTIDDGWDGLLSWFWLACAITTGVLAFVTKAALKERSYSAVMAATGLLYLAILTAFGTDLVARAILAG